MRANCTIKCGRLGLTTGVLFGLLGAGLGSSLLWPARAAAAGPKDGAVPQAAGTKQTKQHQPAGTPAWAPWTTSRFAGTPDPPSPYVVEPAFAKLVFNQPLVMASAPGTDRLFVGEYKGKVYSFPNDPSCDRPDLMLDLAQSRPGLDGLYGLAFHPKFARNRYVYLCYAYPPVPDGSRVSRFEVSRSGPPRIDPKSEKVVISWPSGGHNGGCLQFGPDGCLFISTGDGAGPSPPDPFDTGQDISDLLSSILRIDVDHEEGCRAYRIPPDNPFVGVAGARPEIWAFGLRNPWRMSFDRVTGDLWLGDVGWELWELVDRVERGGNYGWSVVEGSQPVHPEGRRGPGPLLAPTFQHPHSEAASVTGGYVYRGTRLPELVGAYVYGDWQTGKIWALRHDGRQVVWHRELAQTPLQLVSFGEDRAGELYALDYGRTNRIYRISPNAEAARPRPDFPRTLSRTGLFTSAKDLIPAPGVIPYAINAELWSDGARTERHLALPGTARIELDDRGGWKLPEGSVVARTVLLEPETAGPSRRVETQILHFEAGTWRPYSYIWNDAQSDAELGVPEGSSRTLPVRDPSAPGGQRVHTYRFHSRAECLLCHNPWTQSSVSELAGKTAVPLAVNTVELNRDHTAGPHAGNQLRTFEQLGLFSRPLPASPDGLPRLADPYDPSADLGQRARSYLQVNCAHCHIPNAGGTANIVLSYAMELAQTGTVGVRPSQGTFGISGARVIARGDPEGSVLYYRIAKLGGGRMPRLGSDVVDARAVKLIGDWIARLPGPLPHGGSATAEPRSRLGAEEATALALLSAGAGTDPAARTEAIRRLLGSTRGALALLRRIDRGELAEPVRKQVVALAKNQPASEVRDVFERFLAPEERVRRLGDAISSDRILAIKGDAGRGEHVFFSDSAAQCKECHRIGNRGGDLGPELSRIGSKYTKPVLLQHVLEPSRSVDPKYVAFLLETKSGQVHSGLLVEKTDREVVLKDSRSQTVRVPAAAVEQLTPQPKSLMPELLLRDMTAQQAADLIEYLAAQK